MTKIQLLSDLHVEFYKNSCHIQIEDTIIKTIDNMNNNFTNIDSRLQESITEYNQVLESALEEINNYDLSDTKETTDIKTCLQGITSKALELNMMQDTPSEFAQILADNFWDLV